MRRARDRSVVTVDGPMPAQPSTRAGCLSKWARWLETVPIWTRIVFETCFSDRIPTFHIRPMHRGRRMGFREPPGTRGPFGFCDAFVSCFIHPRIVYKVPTKECARPDYVH